MDLMKAVAVVAMLTLVCADFNPDVIDMWGILNILYIKADINMDGTITQAELGQMFATMDRNNDSRINESEFAHMWVPLMRESEDMANAYFLLWDINGDGELDSSDNAWVYTIFDLNGNGIVDSNEFNEEFQNIFHRVPFVVLFYWTDKGTNNDKKLDQQEFSGLFSSFKTAVDGSVTKSNFVSDWVTNLFGTRADADAVFGSFDTDKNDAISVAEVKAKFAGLDKNGDGTLDMRETEVLGDVVPHVHPGKPGQ